MKFALALIAAGSLWGQEVTLQNTPGGAPPEDNSPKATLHGTVANSVTGAPVKKANVHLWPMQGRGSFATTVTDASGSFAFENVTPGNYRVQADHPDFANGSFGGRRGGPQAPGSDLTLAPGEDKRDFTVPIVPAAIVSGRVLDDEGEPLWPCNLQLLHYGWRGKRMLLPVNESSTNDKGEFRFYAVPEGKYFLHVSTHKRLPQRRPLLPPDAPAPGPQEAYGEVFYPGSPDIAGAAPLVLAPGADLQGIEIRVPRVRVTRILGRILGVDEQRGVNIHLVPTNASSSLPFGGSVRVQRLSSSRFECDVAKPGPYRLIAESYGEPQYWAMRDLVVGTAPMDGIELQLQPAANLTGTVEEEAPAEGATAGVAANGGQVQLSSAEPDMMMMFGGRQPAPIQPDHSFTLKNVMPGKWTVNVWGLPGYVKSMRFGDREMAGNELEISAATSGQLRILMGTKMGHIEATVQGGADTTGTAVVAFAEQENGGSVMFIQPDGQGHWKGDVPPGKYRLFAVQADDENLLQQEGVRQAIESRGQAITVEEDGTANADLSLVSPEALKKAAEEDQ